MCPKRLLRYQFIPSQAAKEHERHLTCQKLYFPTTQSFGHLEQRNLNMPRSKNTSPIILRIIPVTSNSGKAANQNPDEIAK